MIQMFLKIQNMPEYLEYSEDSDYCNRANCRIHQPNYLSYVASIIYLLLLTKFMKDVNLNTSHMKGF